MNPFEGLSSLLLGQTLPPITKTIPPDVKEDGRYGATEIDKKIYEWLGGVKKSTAETFKPLPDSLSTVGSMLTVNFLLGTAIIVLVAIGLTGVSASDIVGAVKNRGSAEV